MLVEVEGGEFSLHSRSSPLKTNSVALTVNSIMPLRYISNLKHVSIKRYIAKTLRLVFIGCMLLLCANATAIEYFRWTDENGTVHFTDKPPAGTAYKTLKGRNLASDDVIEKKQDSPLALVNAKRCEEEKKRLHTLQNNTNIRMSNGDKTSFLLSKEQVKSEIGRTKKNIATYCDNL